MRKLLVVATILGLLVGTVSAFAAAPGKGKMSKKPAMTAKPKGGAMAMPAEKGKPGMKMKAAGKRMGHKAKKMRKHHAKRMKMRKHVMKKKGMHKAAKPKKMEAMPEGK